MTSAMTAAVELRKCWVSFRSHVERRRRSLIRQGAPRDITDALADLSAEIEREIDMLSEIAEAPAAE